MVDDSHAVGFVGPGGAGTPELLRRAGPGRHHLRHAGQGARRRVRWLHLRTMPEIVELLRQRSRPYLFSNAVAPAVVAGSMAALELIAGGAEQRDALRRNTTLFRSLMGEAGFEVLRGEHPICPVMFGDARLAGKIAEAMLGLGVYVIAFSYPVVPAGQGPDPGPAVGGALRSGRPKLCGRVC